MHRNDLERAEELLAKAVETYAHDPESRSRYAETLWRRGKQNKAMNQLNQAIKLAGDSPDLIAKRAKWRLALGDVNGALQDADQSLQADSRAAGTWLLRARIARALAAPGNDQLKRALADYHQALCLEPANRETLWEKAQLHWQLAIANPGVGQAQLQRALVTLQALLETYPHDQEPEEVLYLTGHTYAKLSRHANAARSFDVAARHGRPGGRLLYHLAQSQLLAGDPDEALKNVRRALSLAPQNLASQQLLSRIQLVMGRREVSGVMKR